LFRIDRNKVNLSATKSVRVDNMGTEADAVGETQNAAASADYMMPSAEHMATEQANEIIGRAREEAELEAEQIRREARDEVAEIVSNSIAEAEEAHRQAYQEGYEQGAEEGRRSYDEQLKVKMLEDDKMLKRVISEVYDERERTFGNLEEEVIGLSLEIVRKIIAPAEEDIGGVFESLIRNALRQIAPDGKVIIHVSPTEYDRFFASGNAEIEMESGAIISATVLRDTSLGGGDCIIDTEQETVNAGINSQLKYIALAFEKQIL